MTIGIMSPVFSFTAPAKPGKFGTEERETDQMPLDVPVIRFPPLAFSASPAMRKG
jgi:hypothetical protein